MNKKLICLTFLFCLNKLAAQPVEYDFENSENRRAFQNFQKSEFYAQYKNEIDEFTDGIILWKRISKDVMILVENSGSDLFCFSIQFFVWDDNSWRYANELKYTTESSRLRPARIVRDGKLITIYSKSGDVVISTGIPDFVYDT